MVDGKSHVRRRDNLIAARCPPWPVESGLLTRAMEKVCLVALVVVVLTSVCKCFTHPRSRRLPVARKEATGAGSRQPLRLPSRINNKRSAGRNTYMRAAASLSISLWFSLCCEVCCQGVTGEGICMGESSCRIWLESVVCNKMRSTLTCGGISDPWATATHRPTQ